MKVVINKCWGGFSISRKCAEVMAEMGNKTAIAELTTWKQETDWIKYRVENGQWPDNCPKDRREWLEIRVKFGHRDVEFFGYGYDSNGNGYERHSKDLVAAVEMLGSAEASGSCAELRVVEIPDGIEYEIDDYDGMESIHEAHRSWG